MLAIWVNRHCRVVCVEIHHQDELRLFASSFPRLSTFARLKTLHLNDCSGGTLAPIALSDEEKAMSMMRQHQK